VAGILVWGKMGRLNQDDARRIAVNVAKLPALLLDENVVVVRDLVGLGDRILVDGI
jgi:ribosomal protein L18E